MVMERQQYAVIFRSEKPDETEAFKDLLAQVAVAGDDALLRPFFSELNKAIADAQHSYTDSLVTWALELIRTLILANNEVVLAALRTILVSHEYLPLTAHALDVMGTVPELLPVLAEVAASRESPRPLREMAFKTLCTARSSAALPELFKLCEGEPIPSQIVDRSLDFFLKRLAGAGDKRAVSIGMAAVMRWTRSIRRDFAEDFWPVMLYETPPDGILKQADRLAAKADPLDIEKLSQELSRTITEILRTSLFERKGPELIFGTHSQIRRMYVKAIQSFQRTLAKLLQKVPDSPLHVFADLVSRGSALPDWRPDATHFVIPLLAVSEGSEKAMGTSVVQRARDYLLSTPDPELMDLSERVIVYLIRGHLQEVVALGDHAIRAIVEAIKITSQSSVALELRKQALQICKELPSAQCGLEALLLDQDSPLATRRAVARTLDELRRADPSIDISLCAQVYKSLVLTLPPNRFTFLHPPRADNENEVTVLIEALSDKNLSIRRQAAHSCFATAERNRHWFHEAHCRALLPFLDDQDNGLRNIVARVFSQLAPFQHEGIIQGLQEAYKNARERAEKDPPRPQDYYIYPHSRTDEHFELAAALGITLDALTETREKLGQEVASLEERQRELLQRLEGEAVRVGRDIHDEILGRRCGDLSTAIDEEEYQEAKKQLDGLVTDLRRIMNNLSPQDLETDGFLKTIRNRLDSQKTRVLQRTSEFETSFECAPEITDETIETLLTEKTHIVQLYRIILEAITNSIKHAKGHNISVHIEKLEDGAVEINICDDGCGNGGPFSWGNGIPTMLARADAIGVTVNFERTYECGGTKVVIRLDVEGGKAIP
jgi:signal transduction histidine kinase